MLGKTSGLLAPEGGLTGYAADSARVSLIRSERRLPRYSAHRVRLEGYRARGKIAVVGVARGHDSPVEQVLDLALSLEFEGLEFLGRKIVVVALFVERVPA